jgi:hypothetical protein
LNEGTWVRIPTFVNYLTIVPQNPEADGVSSARLLYGLDGRELNLTINGLVLNAPNQLFIKVIDQAGAVSATDTSKQFYVKKKTASLLVFDGWQSFPVANEVYAPLLTQHFGGYNRLDISLNTTFPVSQANLRALIGLYPQVFWYAEETNRQLTYLESAVSVLESYLQTGGKLLLSYSISPNLDPTSDILRLSPIDSVSSVFKDGFVETDGRLLPDSRFANTYTALQNNSGGFVSIVPFYPKAGAEPMFQAELVRGSGQPWPEQPRVTIARIKTANNRTNLIFSTAPLHLFNNGTALSQFMAQVSAEFRP